jgi:hypothetical protein
VKVPGYRTGVWDAGVGHACEWRTVEKMGHEYHAQETYQNVMMLGSAAGREMQGCHINANAGCTALHCPALHSIIQLTQRTNSVGRCDCH